jgi:hypothetical protein
MDAPFNQSKDMRFTCPRGMAVSNSETGFHPLATGMTGSRAQRLGRAFHDNVNDTEDARGMG